MNVSEAFKSRSIKSMLGDHLLRNGLPRLTYDRTRKTTSAHAQVDGSLITSKQRKVQSVFTTMNKLVKEKLRLVGGLDNVFGRIFSVRKGEQLLKASRCSLFTTAGPIAGRLFISTDKLAFCSDKPIAKVSSPAGEPLRFHYKIVIPLRKIKRLNQNENLKKPSQKYLEIVTADGFEFWFMGFVNYKKTLKCLQQAVSQSLIN